MNAPPYLYGYRITHKDKTVNGKMLKILDFSRKISIQENCFYVFMCRVNQQLNLHKE